MNQQGEEIFNRKEIKLLPFLAEFATMKAKAYNTPIAKVEIGQIVHGYLYEGEYVKNANS